jgi:hypothetical protein
MTGRIRILLKVMTSAALTLTCAAACAAQTPAERSRDAVLKSASLTADELSAVERGEAVVKLLPLTDKREVAFCGVTRLRGEPAALLAAFEGSLTRSNNRVILGGGRLSAPPSPEDLQSLWLDTRDVDEMKRCAAGDCDLKLSAAMIERLRTDVDWGVPDNGLRATRLYRQMLSDYARDYLARGDEALIEYEGSAGDSSPAEGQRALLDSLPYVGDYAPEFAAYLRSFPRAELPGVENTLHWSKIKFGFRPVLIVSHTATYTRARGGDAQILVATKQLYANHYLDSSLSLTLLLSAPAAGGASDTYLLYVNRSRADVLDGLLAGVKRRVIESQVTEGLRAILRQTELSVETRPVNQADSDARAREDASSSDLRTPLLRVVGYVSLALSLVAGLLLLWLRRRDLKARGA